MRELIGGAHVLILVLSVQAGEKTVGPGEFIELTAEQPTTWMPVEPTTLKMGVYDQGKVCAFSSGLYHKKIVLFAISASGDPSLPPPVERWVILVENGQPDPPEPGPPPGPSVPAGLHDLTRDAFNQARVIGDQKGVQTWSGALKGAVSASRAGTIRAPEQMSKMVATSIRAAKLSERWRPFNNWLQARLDQLWQEKKINTVPKYTAAYQAVVDGLERVR